MISMFYKGKFVGELRDGNTCLQLAGPDNPFAIMSFEKELCQDIPELDAAIEANRMIITSFCLDHITVDIDPKFNV
jgi:hypothetical protein